MNWFYKEAGPEGPSPEVETWIRLGWIALGTSGLGWLA